MTQLLQISRKEKEIERETYGLKKTNNISRTAIYRPYLDLDLKFETFFIVSDNIKG
jgi:hypothetical protein